MKILTIQKINESGKWIEFWFMPPKEGDPEPAIGNTGWQHCCKAYKFWNAVETAGLNTSILNNGVYGLKTKWIDAVGGLEFDSIVLDEEFETT